MPGASFIRADLHVHTFPDDGSEPDPIEQYIETCVSHEVNVLAITDHNTTKNVAAAIDAAKGTTVYVVPGIEISTYSGHLIALFDPEQVTDLHSFATPHNLQLQSVGDDAGYRSRRSMVDLIEEISHRGGLAVAAHVDAAEGLTGRMNPAELSDILSHEGLVAIEFKDHRNLGWFTEEDEDPVRRAAWRARNSKEGLADRGLARVMSSDAHRASGVGIDTPRRMITRLRMDETNWVALKTALSYNPRARCKPEAPLPASYPHIRGVTFEGGFLGGVRVETSSNLTCLIGGRGSGKSTALIAMRAALGVEDFGDEEDPNDPQRMPEKTIVEYVDRAGNDRRAIRERDGVPRDSEQHTPVQLSVSDLSQGQAGRLAAGYRHDPSDLLKFLDRFCDLDAEWSTEKELLLKLEENAGEVIRSLPDEARRGQLERDQKELQTSLRAAEQGKIEAVARYASILAAEAPLLRELQSLIDDALNATPTGISIDIDRLAEDFSADLSERPAADYVEGGDGLRERLDQFAASTKEAQRSYIDRAKSLAQPVHQALNGWREKHGEWQRLLQERKRSLQEQGLAVQAGELERIGRRLKEVNGELLHHRKRAEAHKRALEERVPLLDQLGQVRDRRYFLRQRSLEAVTVEANHYAKDLTISVHYQKGMLRGSWARWLANGLSFRSPRVERLAAAVTPREFARLVWKRDRQGLLSIEYNGERFFQEDGSVEQALDLIENREGLLELQTLLLEDSPVVEVFDRIRSERRQFTVLSAGQQRSVLLSLMLCAPRTEPMIIDQPEDHLDAGFIAAAVVRHLERAKERRQVIIATHSANLTVLGDAELVIPMYAEGSQGRVIDAGAVDRTETRERVCELLEGGVQAYKRRGERYGLRFNV